MVTPNTDKNAWWIKDNYSREEIDQLVSYVIQLSIDGVRKGVKPPE